MDAATGSGGATDNDGASMKPLVAQKEASVEENVEEKPSLPTSAAPVQLSGKAKEQILYDATKKEVVAEQKIEATKEKIDTAKESWGATGPMDKGNTVGKTLAATGATASPNEKLLGDMEDKMEKLMETTAEEEPAAEDKRNQLL